MTPSFIPSLFIKFLTDNAPEFADLPAKQQIAAADTLYGALTNRLSHNSRRADLFPIFWEDKQRAYGSAKAFETTNQQLIWFRLVLRARVKVRAQGYSLTARASKLGLAYFKQAISETAPTCGGFVKAADGTRYRKPQRAVRSLTANGANSTRFKAAQLQPEMKIDVDDVRQFYAVTQSWLREEQCPPGCEGLYQVWNKIQDNPSDAAGEETANKRVQRASIQALAMLDAARQYRTAGNLLPCTYAESVQGRLYAEGPINLQNCIRELRQAALKGCHEVDIDNCHWALLSELSHRQGVEIPAIDYYLINKDEVRATLAKDLEISLGDAKYVLVALIYGAKLSRSRKGYPSAIQERIGLYSMINACSHRLLVPLYAELKKAARAVVKAAKKNSSKPGWIINDAGRQISSTSKPAKLLAHLLQGAESEILRVCMEWCPGIVVVQHDGFASRDPVDIVPLSAHVKERTGYTVSFSHEVL